MMANYIDIDDAWDEGTLQDWYMNSIDNTIPPIWTEEHISELCNGFIIIPKEAPTADVRPEKHGYWIYQEPDDRFSWKPYLCSACGEKVAKITPNIALTAVQKWTERMATVKIIPITFKTASDFVN